MNINEQCILNGVCPDCFSPMRQWTQVEVDEAKADIGMGPNDDFADCCDKCLGKYLPVNRPITAPVMRAMEVKP